MLLLKNLFIEFKYLLFRYLALFNASFLILLGIYLFFVYSIPLIFAFAMVRYDYPVVTMKRESGANPEQSRCCMLQRFLFLSN